MGKSRGQPPASSTLLAQSMSEYHSISPKSIHSQEQHSPRTERSWAYEVQTARNWRGDHWKHSDLEQTKTLLVLFIPTQKCWQNRVTVKLHRFNDAGYVTSYFIPLQLITSLIQGEVSPLLSKASAVLSKQADGAVKHQLIKVVSLPLSYLDLLASCD